MQGILFKRAVRNLKSNGLSYLALFILLIFCMIMVVANNTTADTLMVETVAHAKAHKVEDGNFTTLTRLTDSEISKLTDKGISIEENFFMEYVLEDKSTLRVYKNREHINLITAVKGKVAKNSNEVMLERRYAEVHKIKVNKNISVGGIDLKITGIGISPDYECVLIDNSSSFTDPTSFGTAFVTAETYDALKASNTSKNAESYTYSYRTRGKLSGDKIKNIVNSYTIDMGDGTTISKLMTFVKAEDSLRIFAAKNDQIVNEQVGIMAGILIFILIAYVISVFVSHEIQEDSSIIGTLYSLGVNKWHLILHYLYAPMLVSLLGGLVGYLIGVSEPMVNMQLSTSYDYFSLPPVSITHPLYLIIYSIIVPPVIAAIVNFIVIIRKLNKPALSLIRKEEKTKKKVSTRSLGNMSFTKKFQLRQFIREGKSSITIFTGLLLSLLVLFLTVNCYTMCTNLEKGARADVKFNYIYTYKVPTATIPDGGEEAYAEVFDKEKYGFKFNITVLGINKSNPYFDVKTRKNKKDVVITSALSQKFDVKVGDKLELKNKDKNISLSFNVVDVTEFSPSFYVFMDIDNMRDVFQAKPDYYNVVMSKDKLDIPSENLFSVTTKSDIIKATELVIEIMTPMIVMLTIASIVIFVTVMYIMLKMNIDKSKKSISLLGVFGYRPNEIRKLYLDGNFFVVLVSALLAIPLGKVIMDMVYPLMCSNLSCGIDIVLPFYYYPVILVAIMGLYVVINALLTFKIKKIKPSDTIKNRE